MTSHFHFNFPQLTIADLAVVTIVNTIDMVVPVTVEKWPKLHNWWNKQMKQLPYYENANHDGLMSLKRSAQSSTDYKINFS